jgi:adenosylmethionine-8-amino-7-oxononanoate aminotransferase
MRHAFRENFFTDVEQAQNADNLVDHHGAELNNAFFIKNGSSIVKI